MNNEVLRRNLLFLIGCLGVRGMLVVAAYLLPLNYLKYLGFIMLLFAAGFGGTWALGLRQGPLGGFGTKMWWQEHRLYHAINFLAFAILAIKKNRFSWLILLFDWILGLSFFMNQHYSIF